MRYSPPDYRIDDENEGRPNCKSDCQFGRACYNQCMINRLLSTQIQRLTLKFPVMAVTGPRQSGKTTLIKQLFPEKKYTSLEDPDIRLFAEQDPRAFLAEHRQGGILDEVQRVPELFSYIQTMVDESNQPGQFILSGSQNFLLSEQISQSLAGRVAMLNLLPLSMAELKDALLLPTDPETMLFKGCYPRLYDNDIDPNDWYPNYISTYLERDVRLIKNITDLSTFQHFLKMCAGRCGQLLNLSQLGSDCGISHNTARSWLNLLDSSFITFRLQPYYRNYTKRLVKTPKLYFYDPGLVCHLLGIKRPEDLTTHYLRGGIFESFIISDIKKHFYNMAQSPDIYFWQDKSKLEVDCIIEAGEHLSAIEIKSGKTISSDFLQNLQRWESLLPPGTSHQMQLIYAGNMKQQRKDILISPWNQVDLAKL